MSYFNTTRLTGEALDAAEETAVSQEDRIHVFFMRNPDDLFTPFDIQSYIEELCNVPITSVRRAMTNLTKDGHLVKTDVQRQGRYGKPCYCWRMATEDERQGDLFQ